MITKKLQSIDLVENSVGMCGVMLLLGVGHWGFYPFCSGLRIPSISVTPLGSMTFNSKQKGGTPFTDINAPITPGATGT
jgi:hypothetical protein